MLFPKTELTDEASRWQRLVFLHVYLFAALPYPLAENLTLPPYRVRLGLLEITLHSNKTLFPIGCIHITNGHARGRSRVNELIASDINTGV